MIKCVVGIGRAVKDMGVYSHLFLQISYDDKTEKDAKEIVNKLYFSYYEDLKDD